MELIVWQCDSDMCSRTKVGEADSTAPWFQRDSTEPVIKGWYNGAKTSDHGWSILLHQMERNKALKY